MHCAAKYYSFDITQLLISGRQRKIKFSNTSALNWACLKNNSEITLKLKDNGADMDLRIDYNDTPFCFNLFV